MGPGGLSVVELDARPDGGAMQDALERMTVSELMGGGSGRLSP